MASQTQFQQTEVIELSPIATPSRLSRSTSDGAQAIIPPEDSLEANFSTTAIPDGGFGWVVVLSASTATFWINGMINCWGVLQTALLSTTLSHVPTSTVSFIGSLNLACGVAFGLLMTRLAQRFGSRSTAMSGVLLMGLGLITAGFSTTNVGGLFATIGLVAGVGINAMYTITNALPVQYFSGRLGLANGLVKLGGGIGGTVMAIALEALVRRVGIEWTFRIQGIMTIATGLPAAWFMKDRVRIRNGPFMELSMFRNSTFTAVFIAGAIGTLALFVPPYYLPLFARSVGLSSGTGAALVAAFNACNAIGRFAAGPLCDKIGPTNTFLITMMMNAITMLAIWPVSSTLAPLMVFAVLNGVANGSFFTVFPTVVASIFGPGRAAVAMSMSITGWTFGYLMGTPIAGYLLQAAIDGKDVNQQGISVYRPAIFYAGGVAFCSSLFVFFARIKMGRGIGKAV